MRFLMPVGGGEAGCRDKIGVNPLVSAMLCFKGFGQHTLAICTTSSARSHLAWNTASWWPRSRWIARMYLSPKGGHCSLSIRQRFSPSRNVVLSSSLPGPCSSSASIAVGSRSPTSERLHTGSARNPPEHVQAQACVTAFHPMAGVELRRGTESLDGRGQVARR